MNSSLSVHPELILVGAGPGDPELLTIKAYRAISEAQVILYDNLANNAILDYASPSCEKMYVGKLPYGAYTPQETIHALIREKAFTVGKVVRLKGGDPFIFGRGFEEMQFAAQEGIPASYIPGITSMQATGLLDIPLTHRDHSDSIWVITGTKKDGSLSADLKIAMQSRATVVIYMGMKKLRQIASIYAAEGHGGMPAAIIHCATLPQEKIIRAPIAKLPDLAEENDLSHPSIIIIGPVTDLPLDKKKKPVSSSDIHLQASYR